MGDFGSSPIFLIHIMVKKKRKRKKHLVKYQITEQAAKQLEGRKDGFVFDIRAEIEWIDEQTGGAFNSAHYAPMIHDEVPILKRGTLAYDEFWDEQDRRCILGYAPVIDGVQYPRISGPHYFYLNHFQIMMLREGDKKKKLNYPYYRVLDHMLFLELEKAEQQGYGIIVGKARRMGLSYVGSVMILWNLLFFKDNTAAVGAGKEDKAQDLFLKVIKSLENIREEYRVSYRKRKDDMKFAYSVTEHKVRKDEGIGSQLDVRTFFSDPSAFEGGSYSFFIFEEIGIHDNLIKSFKASEPCFTEGAIQFGVPFLFGTGGEVEKGSKDYKIMYDNPSSYNLKKLFIPKYMYYPGADPDDKNADEMDMGKNFFDIRTGLNDEKGSLKHIMKRRMRARKSKEGYIKEVQSNPIKESDIFLKTSGGLLNRIALAGQRERIYNKENGYDVVQGSYHWNDTDAIIPLLSRCRNTKEKNLIRIKHNITVRFEEDSDGKAFMLKGIKPINRPGMPWNPDIIGIDSYDEEGVAETGSLGCSLVYRCYSNMSNDYDMPIAYINERGDGTSEDSFWDNSLKQSVYFQAESLVEYTKVAIVGYFQDIYAHKYLRVNPTLRDDLVTNNGKQQYGVRMTSGKNGFKTLVTTLLKTEVRDNVDKMHFEGVIDDLIEYGDKNTDIAMAFGVCLIHKLDLFDYITEDLQDEVGEADVLMDWVHAFAREDGTVELKAYDKKERSDEMETFDPRKHLEGDQREQYLQYHDAQMREREKQKKKNEETYLANQAKAQDPFKNQIEQYLKEKQ